jgi:hypothetical protein
MARCIPDFIEDKDEGHPEWVFFDRLKAELPDGAVHRVRPLLVRY